MASPRSSPPLLALAAVGALAACGPEAREDADARQPDAQIVDAVRTEQCTKMDLVFVIDNSPTMDQEQTNLAANFPAFANVLNAYRTGGGEQLDYRAAITTTGITSTYTIVPPLPPPSNSNRSQTGDDGKFRKTCGMTRSWLERTDPDMESTFACAAQVGTSGPAIEMPLHAAELALRDSVNPGFVREDALLGLVFITDEDDCSRRMAPFETHGDECATNGDTDMAAVLSFVDGFDQLKRERGRWAAAVIAGPSECMSAFGSAADAVRLKQFVHEMGPTGVFGNICAGSLAPALEQALDVFQTACENFPPID